MKYYYSAICVALCALSASAFAEDARFTGPSVGASIAYQANTVAMDGLDGVGQNSSGVVLNGSYGLAMNESAVVLFGLDYNLSDIKSGEISDLGSIKLDKAYSLSIAPGILINDHSLAYVKLSFESAELTAGSLSEKFKGTGVGFGLRSALNKNTYLNAEIKQVKYDSKIIDGANIKPTTTIGTVGVGFNF
jgi:hypothetical protein